MTTKKFFITTPIYYTNGVPHIGHAYASIIGDIIARYKKINGYQVKFSTGVDENSQKAVLEAEKLKMETMDYLDMMAKKHKQVWDGLKIEYTDFIRTTATRHHEFVQKILQQTYESGDIYEGVYEGLYCVGCEAFKKEGDLTPDGLCPDHLKAPERIKEKNYFFRLSKYQDKILEYYEKNKDFVIPQGRFNEIIEFVKGGLEDFSISRETNKFGISLPFDSSQVAYVWYDALLNYITVCQGGDEEFWPASLHIVGKDIIKFHGIYWLAMLMSVGYEIPKQILTTGYFTINGQKISKTLGNVIDPVEFSNKYSKDLMSLYLLSSFPVGQDGDFNEEQAITMYNAKLANNLGNLVNRAVVLTLKLGESNLNGTINENISISLKKYKSDYSNFMENYDLKNSLDCTFAFLDEINKFMNDTKPWELFSDPEKNGEISDILYTVIESLRVVSVNLYPFFKDKMSQLLASIGLNNYPLRLENGEREKILDEKCVFEIREKGEILFSRMEKS